IDDTFCAAHGGQQLGFWNAHHDERGFAPMHIYHVASGTPVVAILRPARTAKGTEVRCVIKHVTKRLRKHWPNTRIVWRGDGHYGRVGGRERAESDGTDYIFGVAGNPALDVLMAETADNLRFHHAKSNQAKLRTYASFFYQAGSWDRPRHSRRRPMRRLRQLWGRAPAPLRACARHHSSSVTLRLRFDLRQPGVSIIRAAPQEETRS